MLLFSDIIQPLKASHPPPHTATLPQVLLVELNLHKTLRNKNPKTKKKLSHRFDLNGGESSHQAMESEGDDRCEERLQSGRGGWKRSGSSFVPAEATAQNCESVHLTVTKTSSEACSCFLFRRKQETGV